MCLYNFITCLAHNHTYLYSILKNPPQEVLLAGLVCCVWYEAVINNSNNEHTGYSSDRHASTHKPFCWPTKPQSGIFHGNKDICPYVVIRHDEEILEEDLQRISEAVLLDGLSTDARGCVKCWDLVFTRKWMGRMPTDAEKMEILYTTDRIIVDEDDMSEASGSKRKRSPEHDRNRETLEGEILSMIDKRDAKQPRSENAIPTSPQLSSSAAPARKKRVVTSEPRIEGEVMPPPPPSWEMTPTESETYVIKPTGDGRNWNFDKDKKFQNFMGGQKGGAYKRQEEALPVEEEDPLQASKNQMELELAINLSSAHNINSSSAGRGLCPVDGQSGRAESAPMMSMPNPLLTSLPLTLKYVDGEKVRGDEFVAATTANRSDSPLFVPEVEEAEISSDILQHNGQDHLQISGRVPRKSTILDPSSEKGSNESNTSLQKALDRAQEMSTKMAELLKENNKLRREYDQLKAILGHEQIIEARRRFWKLNKGRVGDDEGGDEEEVEADTEECEGEDTVDNEGQDDDPRADTEEDDDDSIDGEDGVEVMSEGFEPTKRGDRWVCLEGHRHRYWGMAANCASNHLGGKQ